MIYDGKRILAFAVLNDLIVVILDCTGCTIPRRLPAQERSHSSNRHTRFNRLILHSLVMLLAKLLSPP